MCIRDRSCLQLLLGGFVEVSYQRCYWSGTRQTVFGDAHKYKCAQSTYRHRQFLMSVLLYMMMQQELCCRPIYWLRFLKDGVAMISASSSSNTFLSELQVVFGIQKLVIFGQDWAAFSLSLASFSLLNSCSEFLVFFGLSSTCLLYTSRCV